METYTNSYLNINGYEVNFPFQPYESQAKIMSSMLTSFEKEQNLLLESPTGTGKCMSALGASFAYLNNFKSLRNNKKAIENFREYKKIILNLSEIKKSIIYHKKKQENSSSDRIEEVYKIYNNENNIYDNSIFEYLSDEIFQNMDKRNPLSYSHGKNGRVEEFENDKNAIFLDNKLNVRNENIKTLPINFNLINQNKKNLKILFDYDKHDFQSVSETKKKVQNAIQIVKKEITAMDCIPPTFIFCVRTSSQIDVVYDELQKANEIIFFQTAFLKSRNYHCLNKILSEDYKNDDLILACKKLQKSKELNQCQLLKNSLRFPITTYDKELKSYKFKHVCPYYSEIKKVANADLIICNYNYIIQNKSIKILEDFVFNPIIIIDEAHNFLDALEGNFNNQLSIKNFIDAIEELELIYKKLIDKINNNNIEQQLSEENVLNNPLFEKINYIYNLILLILKNIIYLNQSRTENDFSNPQEYRGYMIFALIYYIFSNSFDYQIKHGKTVRVYNLHYNEKFYYDLKEKIKFKNQFFDKLKTETFINLENYKEICKIMKTLEDESFDLDIKERNALKKIKFFFISFFENLYENFSENIYSFNKDYANVDDYYYILDDEKGSDIDKDIHMQSKKFSNLNELVNILFCSTNLNLEEKVSEEINLLNEINIRIDKMKSKKISLICLNPSLGFSKIKKTFGPRTIMNLMSGTLNPFDFYQFQLRTEFPLRLTTEHIIEKKNVNVMLIKDPIIKYINPNKKILFYDKNLSNMTTNIKNTFINKKSIMNSISKISCKKIKCDKNDEEYDINKINYPFDYEILNSNNINLSLNEFTNININTNPYLKNYDAFLSLNSNKYNNKNKSKIRRKGYLENLKFTYSNMQEKNKKDLLLENILKIIFDFSNVCLTGNLVFMKSFEFIKDFKLLLEKCLIEANINFKLECYNNLYQIFLDEDLEENQNQFDNESTNNNLYKNINKNSNINSDKCSQEIYNTASTDKISKNYINRNNKINRNKNHNQSMICLDNQTSKRMILLYFDCGISNNKIKNDLIKQYQENCEKNLYKNFLFTVMRGTLSEGVNFKNYESTSVFIVGVPFAKFNDPIVTLKRKYLDEKYEKNFYVNDEMISNKHILGNNQERKNSLYNISKNPNFICPLNGNDWYSMEAINCVNQAIGRSIRNKNDFANIIIIDEQYMDYKHQSYFSAWIKELEKKIVCEDNYYQSFDQVNKFFMKFSGKNFLLK